MFLQLVRKHFHQYPPLYKVLNHRCLKQSYCCLGNIKNEITSHNKRLRNSTDVKESPMCDCRNKDLCPLDGNCQKSNLVYQAEITTKEGDHGIYIGTTGNTFKERYRGHKTSLKNESKAKTTELSKFYWILRNKGREPEIKWSVIKEIKSGHNPRKGCTAHYAIPKGTKFPKRTERDC